MLGPELEVFLEALDITREGFAVTAEADWPGGNLFAFNGLDAARDTFVQAVGDLIRTAPGQWDRHLFRMGLQGAGGTTVPLDSLRYGMGFLFRHVDVEPPERYLITDGRDVLAQTAWGPKDALPALADLPADIGADGPLVWVDLHTGVRTEVFCPADGREPPCGLEPDAEPDARTGSHAWSDGLPGADRGETACCRQCGMFRQTDADRTVYSAADAASRLWVRGHGPVLEIREDDPLVEPRTAVLRRMPFADLNEARSALHSVVAERSDPVGVEHNGLRQWTADLHFPHAGADADPERCQLFMRGGGGEFRDWTLGNTRCVAVDGEGRPVLVADPRLDPGVRDDLEALDVQGLWDLQDGCRLPLDAGRADGSEPGADREPGAVPAGVL